MQYTKAEIYEIFSRFKQNNANPKTELNYSNAYTLLVAVILSAQSTDVGVNKATSCLFCEVDSAAAMLDYGEERLIKAVKTIGLWRGKVKNILAMSRILVDRYNGEVPSELDALIELPGVGRKTALVVQNTVFGKPTLAVDTHIFRLANRLHLADADNVLAVERKLVQIIPAEFLYNAHHWLILHGRYVCKARTPLCGQCIIADLCKYEYKTNDKPAIIQSLN